MAKQNVSEKRLERLEDLFERQYSRTLANPDSTQSLRLVNLRHTLYANKSGHSYQPPYKPAA